MMMSSSSSLSSLGMGDKSKAMREFGGGGGDGDDDESDSSSSSSSSERNEEKKRVDDDFWSDFNREEEESRREEEEGKGGEDDDDDLKENKTATTRAAKTKSAFLSKSGLEELSRRKREEEEYDDDEDDYYDEEEEEEEEDIEDDVEDDIEDDIEEEEEEEDQILEVREYNNTTTSARDRNQTPSSLTRSEPARQKSLLPSANGGSYNAAFNVNNKNYSNNNKEWRKLLPHYIPASELLVGSRVNGEVVFVDYQAQFNSNGKRKTHVPMTVGEREMYAQNGGFGGGGGRGGQGFTFGAENNNNSNNNNPFNTNKQEARWYTTTTGVRTYITKTGQKLTGKKAYDASIKDQQKWGL